MCGVADLYLHVLLDSYRGVIFFRIFERFVFYLHLLSIQIQIFLLIVEKKKKKSR